MHDGQMMSYRAKPAYMSITDTAIHLAVSRRTVKRWIADDKIVAVKINGIVRIPIAEIERLVNQDAMPKEKR